MEVINVCDFPTEWNWLKEEFKLLNLNSQNFTSQSIHSPSFTPKRDSYNRAAIALKAVLASKKQQSILVSHGPRPTQYTANMARFLSPETPHLSLSFNFTELPTGFQHKTMTKAFKQPTKFVTYSTDERQLYADYFDIPIELIDMQYWSIHEPEINLASPAIENGSYICALGSQARDYKTLFQAMKKLQHIKLVVVATEENLKGLDIPSNVIVHSNISLSKAMNILTHSEFMVLPLRSSFVPCGVVTIVSAMFHKKAIIVTDSSGVYDYVKDGETGLFYEAQNVDDLIQKITSMWEDKKILNSLSKASYQFAKSNCTEKSVLNYFSNFVNSVNR